MWPYVVLSLFTLQRISELLLSRSNTANLLAAGAEEVGAEHYPVIVAFHSLWLLGLWILAPAQVYSWALIAVLVILQALRAWVIFSLGQRWTTRIIRVPHEKLIESGLYQYHRHPNYIVVVIEILVLPLAFGLVAYAVIGGLINIGIVAWRIRAENAALALLR